jgi:hypothetical protein
VDEAMRARKCAARDSTLDRGLRLAAQGARPAAGAAARAAQPYVHPLWTMPLYAGAGASAPPSPAAASSSPLGTRATFRATAQSKATATSPWAMERVGSFSEWLTDALADDTPR